MAYEAAPSSTKKRRVKHVRAASEPGDRDRYRNVRRAGAVAGWDLRLLESAAFARRTPDPDLPAGGATQRSVQCLLISPSRRGHSELAFERPTECFFELIADRVCELSDRRLFLTQILLCSLKSPDREVSDRGHADEQGEAVYESAARQPNFLRQGLHRPRIAHVPMDKCQGSSDMLVAKALQPSTFLVFECKQIVTHRLDKEQLGKS